VLDISAQVTALAERAHELLSDRPRVLVALAGAPGSGKSALAAALLRRFRETKVPAEIVPMDGFHLDNAVLDARGLRQRKGSPETLDGHGFLHLIRRLKEGSEVVAPIFDRARDIAIAGAQVVPAETKVVIVEGNYLLFDEDPWRELASLWTSRRGSTCPCGVAGAADPALAGPGPVAGGGHPAGRKQRRAQRPTGRGKGVAGRAPTGHTARAGGTARRGRRPARGERSLAEPQSGFNP
jgi:hypothetical protein